MFVMAICLMWGLARNSVHLEVMVLDNKLLDSLYNENYLHLLVQGYSIVQARMHITPRIYEVMLKCVGVLKCCACWLLCVSFQNMCLLQNTGVRRVFVLKIWIYFNFHYLVYIMLCLNCNHFCILPMPLML